MSAVIFRKQIPHGTKLPVSFSRSDAEMMRRELCIDPSVLALGLAKGTRLCFDLSLDDIEELQGAVAAEANHAKDRKLRDRLDRLDRIFSTCRISSTDTTITATRRVAGSSELQTIC